MPTSLPLPASKLGSWHNLCQPITQKVHFPSILHCRHRGWLMCECLTCCCHPLDIQWSISELSHTPSQGSRDVSPWLRAPSWLLPLPAVTFNARQTACASELKVSWRLWQILPSLLRNAAIPCSHGPCAVWWIWQSCFWGCSSGVFLLLTACNKQ